MDQLAEALNMDPLQFRLKMFLKLEKLQLTGYILKTV